MPPHHAACPDRSRRYPCLTALPYCYIPVWPCQARSNPEQAEGLAAITCDAYGSEGGYASGRVRLAHHFLPVLGV